MLDHDHTCTDWWQPDTCDSPRAPKRRRRDKPDAQPWSFHDTEYPVYDASDLGPFARVSEALTPYPLTGPSTKETSQGTGVESGMEDWNMYLRIHSSTIADDTTRMNSNFQCFDEDGDKRHSQDDSPSYQNTPPAHSKNPWMMQNTYPSHQTPSLLRGISSTTSPLEFALPLPTSADDLEVAPSPHDSGHAETHNVDRSPIGQSRFDVQLQGPQGDRGGLQSNHLQYGCPDSSLSPTARSLTCVHQGCAGAFTGRWAHRNPMRHLKQKHQSHSSLGAAERYENAVLPCRHNECTRTYAREDARLKHERTHPELHLGPAVRRKKPDGLGERRSTGH